MDSLLDSPLEDRYYTINVDEYCYNIFGKLKNTQKIFKVCSFINHAYAYERQNYDQLVRIHRAITKKFNKEL